MTTINDQPQEKLARYADSTGAKFEVQFREGAPYFETIGLTAELAILTHKIRLVLSDYGLPSHLTPYKDNPRMPGEGYRVPTGEDSRNQPNEYWSDIRNGWCHHQDIGGVFDGKFADYRLPASVLPPDWDEMTREDMPEKEAKISDKHPEIFEAHGLGWYRHTPGDPMPCDPDMRVDVAYMCGVIEKGNPNVMYCWEHMGHGGDIIGWRPADAPAKLPRPGPQPQDDVQALKARVQELEKKLKNTLQGKARASLLAEDHLRTKLQAMHRRAQRAESKLAKALKDAKKWKACAEWWRDSVHNIAKKAIAEEQEKPATASTPTLRPIAEMPAEVPEGCVRVFGGYYENQGEWIISSWSRPQDTHFLDIRLPAPPDPDAELRREFEAWMKGHYQIPKSTLTFIKENGVYALREHETAFQAYKAGRCAHPQGAAA